MEDDQYYQILERDPTKRIINIIRITVQDGLLYGYINEKTPKFLMKENPKVLNFYGLPKIHKSIRPLPLRPIVSGWGSALEPLAKFIDSYLQKIIPKISTYIKGTTHFISLVENLRIPNNSVLISMDVNSLYTNIPHEGTRITVQKIQDNDLYPPTQFLMNLLDLVLKNNYFTQNKKKKKKQTKGVAMGSPCAPSIANLYMADFEEQFLLNANNKPIIISG